MIYRRSAGIPARTATGRFVACDHHRLAALDRGHHLRGCPLEPSYPEMRHSRVEAEDPTDSPPLRSGGKASATNRRFRGQAPGP
jgi:hypothetical protein